MLSVVREALQGFQRSVDVFVGVGLGVHLFDKIFKKSLKAKQYFQRTLMGKQLRRTSAWEGRRRGF